jgi:hypothetical protein
MRPRSIDSSHESGAEVTALQTLARRSNVSRFMTSPKFATAKTAAPFRLDHDLKLELTFPRGAQAAGKARMTDRNPN